MSDDTLDLQEIERYANDPHHQNGFPREDLLALIARVRSLEAALKTTRDALDYATTPLPEDHVRVQAAQRAAEEALGWRRDES